MFSSVSNTDGTRRIIITTSGRVSIDLPAGVTFIQRQVGDSYNITVKFQEGENTIQSLISTATESVKKGKRNYSPRLTDEQKEEINRLSSEYPSLKLYEIAEKVGVTKAQVIYCLRSTT